MDLNYIQLVAARSNLDIVARNREKCSYIAGRSRNFVGYKLYKLLVLSGFIC